MAVLLVFLGLIAASAALPTTVDPVIRKLGGEQRYQPMRGGNGVVHMVDTWLKVNDLREAARYTPDTENTYHLFTRENPTTSQVLLYAFDDLLSNTNFDPNRRTIVIVHGWTDSCLGDVNTVLTPAFLAAEDVNVICADWSAGADTVNYIAAVLNTVTSGEAVARFINWLNAATGATPDQYHIVGHSLGGHQAGIIGRNVDDVVDYITALDPALPGWLANDDKFRSDDGAYTEVIHTNAGLLGYMATLGQVDFYPNGGIGMPGCYALATCDHSRGIHYLAESIQTGGFTGTGCVTYVGAMAGTCFLSDNLQMGGLEPKTGPHPVYHRLVPTVQAFLSLGLDRFV